MKRISIIALLLVLVPAVSQAGHAQRFRVRYSPYAFSYHNSGLIPGNLRYSMYAFDYGNRGLVPFRTRYTPYAFSYGNRGLVVDPCWWPRQACATQREDTARCAPQRRPVARRTTKPRHAISSAELRESKKTDGMHVIRKYLREHGLGDARISYRVGLKNQTVAVTFILRDKGLLIRYRNPELIEAIQTGETPLSAQLERHEQLWETFAQRFEKNGGAVYCVNTTDREQMLAALDNCDALRPTTVYAKQ